MRLDKFISECTCLSRSEAKKALKNGCVLLNGEHVNKPEVNIDENNDVVSVNGKDLVYEKFVYFMLNKPSGVVSATKDNKDKTVTDLITCYERDDLFPVGRLDKDTTGLLLLTNDGELAHRLLSPSRKIFKDYYVTCKIPVTKAMCESLSVGVDINDEEKTLPAIVKMVNNNEMILSICEGRFHEVKRMMLAVGNEVVSLKRISMGTLVLDESLEPGSFRRLEAFEIARLKEISGIQ